VATSTRRKAGCLHQRIWIAAQPFIFFVYITDAVFREVCISAYVVEQAFMSVAEHFRQAWNARFPSELPPDLPCLTVDQDQVSGDSDSYVSVYGTVYNNLNPAAVEHTLQACNASIAQLHLQLERQQFVAEFLWEVLHSINTTSITDRQPAPLSTKSSTKSSSHAKDRPGTVSRETDLSGAGLDSIVPILESPSSGNFSPPSLDGVDRKVFPVDQTAGITDAESSVVDLNKSQQPLMRKHSLPLLDSEQNNPEFESDGERTVSLDSKPEGIDTSFPGRRAIHSPSLRVQKAHRQKPVPTPRVTVFNKQPVVQLEDSAVGESCTEDFASSGSYDSLLHLQHEHVGVNDGNEELFSKHPEGSHASLESISSASDDQKVCSVKERALAFSSPFSSNTSSPSVPVAQKPANTDNLPSADSSLPRRMGQRRVERVHVYEEVLPIKQDEADSDEAEPETGAVSSDDEEPLYYNLKMLQQTMLNRAKTFYSKGAQKPVAERSGDADTGRSQKSRLNRLEEDNTQQLSGDSSKYHLTVFIWQL